MRSLLACLALGLAVLAAPAAAGDRPAAPAAGVTAKAPAPAAGTPLVQRPAPRSLEEARRRLDAQRVSVDFREMELADVVAFVARVAGFNVIVAPELQRDGLDALPHLTMKLERVSLLQVVDLTLRFTDTALAFDGGILRVTTKAAARGKPVLRIYPIGELTAPLMNFPGPDINLHPSGAEFEDEEVSEVENPFADGDKVAEMVKEYVAADTWDDEGVSIAVLKDKLVVRQYPKVQREIARFLALLRAAR